MLDGNDSHVVTTVMVVVVVMVVMIAMVVKVVQNSVVQDGEEKRCSLCHSVVWCGTVLDSIVSV